MTGTVALFSLRAAHTRIIGSIFFLAALCPRPFVAAAAHAGTPEQEVVAVIKTLFEGMKTGDTAKIRATLDISARLQTTGKNKEGKLFARLESVDEWLKSVAAPKPQGVVYDERILAYEVKMDDNLASVWTPYEFYVGDKFNHCGSNAFHLYKSETGWKILQITDTRRKEGCGKQGSQEKNAK